MSQLNVTTLKHESAGVDNITLASNGFVGIGTSNPQQMLEVSTGSSNNGVRIRRYPTGAYYSDIVHTTAPEGLAFKIGDGSTVTERMRIDSAGRVTMPYQPAFETGFSAAVSLSDGSVCVFNWVGFNRGGHYSNSTGRFTAPITGVYQFQYSNNIQRLTGSWTGFHFAVNGTSVHVCYADGLTSWMNMSMSVLLYLQAGDYVNIVSRGSGNMQHDSKDYGTFTGQLIG